MLTVRKSILTDAGRLASVLREQDKKELSLLSTESFDEVLRKGFLLSSHVYSVVDANDYPQVMFGVVPSDDDGVGYVWLLASNVLDTHAKQLLKETPQWLAVLFKDYKLLANIVWAGNKKHINWLKHEGFKFIDTWSGKDDELFYEFVLTKYQVEGE